MFPLKSVLKFLLLQWGYGFAHIVQMAHRPLGGPLDGSEIHTVCVSPCLIAMFLEYTISAELLQDVVMPFAKAIFQS